MREWAEVLEAALEAYEERAAIMEYDGGLSREAAEEAARRLWPEASAWTPSS